MDSRVNEVLVLIDEHFMERVSISALANKVGLTASHLARIFRASLGIAPRDRLLDVRFRHATRMLSTTRLPVVEIGIRCGCFDPSHFVRDFESRYKLTPTQYRERYHIGLTQKPKPVRRRRGVPEVPESHRPEGRRTASAPTGASLS